MSILAHEIWPRLLPIMRVEDYARGGDHDNPFPPKVTTGWDPDCEHAAEPIPATVLDPFVGSGTTIMVALRLGRSGIGIRTQPRVRGDGAGTHHR